MAAELKAGELRVLYFAWLRERIGRSEDILAMPDGVSTVADLMAWLAAREPGAAAAFAQPNLVRCAVNQDFAPAETAIAPGDEVAFFPPMTGG